MTDSSAQSEPLYTPNCILKKHERIQVGHKNKSDKLSWMVCLGVICYSSFLTMPGAQEQDRYEQPFLAGFEDGWGRGECLILSER